MRLGKELRKSLVLNLLNKVLIACVAIGLVLPHPALADPIVNEITLPPLSFTRIDDNILLEKIGMGGSYSAWCYDDEANAILISAPARERARCELRLTYELEKQKVKNQFEIDRLSLRIETLINQHKEINLIKDREIDRLTQAALKRPNDYSVWWATGGFVLGIASTILVVSATK
jgi:hypothetical protein